MTGAAGERWLRKRGTSRKRAWHSPLLPLIYWLSPRASRHTRGLPAVVGLMGADAYGCIFPVEVDSFQQIFNPLCRTL